MTKKVETSIDMQKAIDVLKAAAISAARKNDDSCLNAAMPADQVLAAIDVSWDLNTRRKVYRDFLTAIRELSAMGYARVIPPRSQYASATYRYTGPEAAEAEEHKRVAYVELQRRIKAFLKKHDLGSEVYKYENDVNVRMRGVELEKLMDLVEGE